MRVVMLGCGGSAGVPMLGAGDGAGDWGACDPAEPRNRRTRSSIVIEHDDGRRILVDTTPDLREQLLRAGIGRVDALFFTHAHADHVAGLDDVRGLNRAAGGPLPVYGTAPVLAELRSRFEYAFRPWSPPGIYRPILEPRPIAPDAAVEIAGLPLRVFRQSHGRQDTSGFRCGPFAYSTDVSALDEAALRVLDGVSCWIVGCFGRDPHPAHADVASVRRWAERVRCSRTVLTHMGTDLDWDWMARELPPGLEAGRDGLELRFPPVTASAVSREHTPTDSITERPAI
ncbi:MAG: MBL fold metallo-hydrolase [Gluconacetobacter diazotrophicus]|nr:MBL fold metallo-hydrolase [Gluconacetobacter diazotrophicus]